jgi:toxin ParE1/3/4
VSRRVVITDRALSDLRHIRDYIARHSPLNAARFLERVLAELDVIEASPESFAKAPEDELVSYTLRQFVVKPYRVLYRVAGGRVEILHVRHGARLPAKPTDLP